ncbi:MAG: DUF3147 family protein [Ignavibacteria bacterium]|jgi:uncharacterized membrane protein (GlpM family)|nr:DUF3147 family protein [Ignavibacteria bacterium]MCU7511069.1 DUF3147 family protein [Ignavibacteria bacterium]MCU7522647.1 DUF3147 family protein [Ignavibacteria bacterium]MCU7525898.1 DUF3147 family protein [Ignavibacteria bacterium]HEX2927928.1 DUF3147 family protein [Ruminiclostridium sp.]
MIYYIVKVLISAAIIVFVSEVSKRSTLIGSIFASMPLVSILAFIWLYYETKSKEQVSELSTGIFWLVIPSLSMFILLPYLLRKMDFIFALIISIVVMVLFYFLMIYILEKFGIKI